MHLQCKYVYIHYKVHTFSKLERSFTVSERHSFDSNASLAAQMASCASPTVMLGTLPITCPFAGLYTGNVSLFLESIQLPLTKAFV